VTLAVLVVGTVVVGWALPWLGWTLLGFLVLDAVLGAWQARPGGPGTHLQSEGVRDGEEEELVA